MALNYLSQLLGFFKEAGKYASPDEDAVERAGSEAPRHVSFHKRIVAVSVIFGFIGALIGVGMIVLAIGENAVQDDGAEILLAPLVFAAAGLVFGVSVTCLFAPRSFITGPVGQKWMQLIGTQSAVVARVVCLLFTMLLLGFIALMAWAAWSDMQR
jgi:CBS-domain-containing membrane protein